MANILNKKLVPFENYVFHLLKLPEKTHECTWYANINSTIELEAVGECGSSR